MSETKSGLYWPDQQPPPTDRALPEGATRRPMVLWDRIKILLGLGGAWTFLFLNELTSPAVRENQISVDIVITYSLRKYLWLVLLFFAEVVRQLHYLISEQSPAYHRFWTESVFGGFERSVGRMNDYTRFRVARALKWVFLLVVLNAVMAALLRCGQENPVLGCQSPVTALLHLPRVIWNLLPLILQIMFAIVFLVIQFVALFWFLSKGGVDVYMPEDIKTRFSDVWGQDHVLEKVKENMIFLEDPESIEAKGGYVPGGILLWGPPGTGKTLMAEAMAGETNRPFVFVEPGAFINMFFGVGILKVKALFRKLRKLALRYGGVIVFFDEADSLGNRGLAVAGTGEWRPQGGMTPPALAHTPPCNGLGYLSPATQATLFHASLEAAPAEPRRGIINRIIVGAGLGGGGMGTLQALLTELSGLKKPRGFVNRVIRKALGMRPKPPPKYRILVVMATNMPSALDPALLRPGRIDRIYKVGYPSKEGRMRTYEGYLAKVRHNLTREQVEKLAIMTPYATGASIKDLVNEALIYSIRAGRDWITWEDIIKARLLKALGPPEDVEYIERERHAVALHEACHAVVAYRVRKHLAIDIATIEKGQDYLGMVASIPLEEQFTQWKSEYECDLMVALAALAGERLFFDGDNSSGVTGDLQSATTLAMLMEGYWGMGDTVGSHAVVRRPTGQPITDTSRNVLETELGRRIERKLQEIMERTRRLLEENRREILAVAHALEVHKTLTGDDVMAVIEGTVGPLVDGRPYRDPAFMAQIEDYHRRAVEAHKRHGRLEVPLPVYDQRRYVLGALVGEVDGPVGMRSDPPAQT